MFSIQWVSKNNWIYFYDPETENVTLPRAGNFPENNKNSNGSHHTISLGRNRHLHDLHGVNHLGNDNIFKKT